MHLSLSPLSDPLLLLPIHKVQSLSNCTTLSILNMATTSSNFEAIMDVALAKYTKQTGKDLRNHPLALKINQCDSADSILAVFQEQAQEFAEFRNGNPNLIKWLQPVVTGLYTLSTSSAFRGGVNLVSPSKFGFSNF